MRVYYYIFRIPIALDVVLYKRRPLLFIWWCLISFVTVSVSIIAQNLSPFFLLSRPPSSLSLCLTSIPQPTQVPLVAIDSVYYGRPVLAPLNIVLYNVFGKGGPNLYGIISAKLPNSFTVVLLLYTFKLFRCGATELLSYQWSTELQCCLHPGPPCPASCRIPGNLDIFTCIQCTMPGTCAKPQLLWL